MIVKVKRGGEVVDILIVENTIENNRKIQSLEKINSISQNGKQYKIVSSASNLFSGDTLICHDSLNTDKVIISTDKEYCKSLLFHIGLVIALIAIFFIIFIISKLNRVKKP